MVLLLVVEVEGKPVVGQAVLHVVEVKEVPLVVLAVLLLYRLVAHHVWLVVEQQCTSALSQQVVQHCQTLGLTVAATVDL